MKAGVWKSNGLLFLTAAIWGFAFVAQRAGMAHVGPFTFNAVRFALGGLALVPLLLRSKGRQANHDLCWPQLKGRMIFLGGGLAGLFLFLGASLQQWGIVYTTAGKAGFITGLYVIIVPILGLLWGWRSGLGTWLGAILATAGLYFLSISQHFTMSPGDGLVLGAAFLWAGHVHVIGWLSPRAESIKLAFGQFMVCSGLSLIVALLVEEITIGGLVGAAIPILYAGLLSSGVAYTLQVVAQRWARPAHAAIILSLEAVFALLGGWLLLAEILSRRELLGCLLMLGGMFVSQLDLKKK